MHLLEQDLQPRQAVAGRARHDATRPTVREQLGVGEVGLVAPKVHVDTCGARDRSRNAIRRNDFRRNDADPARAGFEDLVAHDEGLEVGQPSANCRHGVRDALEPSRREVLLQAADAVEHVVHPTTGGFLHDRLQLLSLTERVEDRGDGTELEGVGAEEHQVVEHPVELGQQRARPDRAFRHLHPQHPFHAEHHAELRRERGEPVVAVGQDDDLAVVAHLEQLLGAAVHVAHDGFGRDDALAVDDDPQPQHAVGRGVLRADVQDHVRGGQAARTHADRELTSAFGGGHPASLPHVGSPPGGAAGRDAPGACASSVSRDSPGCSGCWRLGPCCRSARARCSRGRAGP